MNLANRITILRLLVIPFFIMAILYSRLEIALIIFALAALSDGVDGYIARKYNQKTELGRILDPLADKILIISALICLSVSKTIAPSFKLPPYVPIIIISRDAIIILGVLLIYVIKGEINIKPTLISKITTFFQMLTIIAVLMSFQFSSILWNLAIGFTLVSGIDYIIKGSKILSEK